MLQTAVKVMIKTDSHQHHTHAKQNMPSVEVCAHFTVLTFEPGEHLMTGQNWYVDVYYHVTIIQTI